MLVLLMSKRFMNYAVYMGSGAITYVPSSINIDLGNQKLLGVVNLQTHREQGLIYFF
jgi:hypothetical protein